LHMPCRARFRREALPGGSLPRQLTARWERGSPRMEQEAETLLDWLEAHALHPRLTYRPEQGYSVASTFRSTEGGIRRPPHPALGRQMRIVADDLERKVGLHPGGPARLAGAGPLILRRRRAVRPTSHWRIST
jgi:hypothetical protein